VQALQVTEHGAPADVLKITEIVRAVVSRRLRLDQVAAAFEDREQRRTAGRSVIVTLPAPSNAS
jgi:hypothetical protein